VFAALIAQTVLWQGAPSWFAALPSALRVPPEGWRALGGIPFAPPLVVALLEAAFVVACALAAAGLFTRASTLVAAALGLYLLGLPQSFGKLNHYHHLIWFAVLLAASPCGDAFSLDRRWRRRAETSPAPGTAYGLPVRIGWILIGLLYLFPGAWKLLVQPAGWLSGEHLVGHLHAKWHELGGFRPPLPIDRWPLACLALSIFTLVFELGFLPLVLFRRTRALAVGAGLLFHGGTWLAMRISFLPLLACYVVFVPWSALLRRLRAPAPSGVAEPAVSEISSRSPKAPAVVGTILIAGAATAGVLGFDGWPFAVYPRFHYRPPEVVATLRAERQVPQEAAVAIATPAFVDRLHSSRWVAIAGSLAQPAPAADHTRRVLAVSRLYLEESSIDPLRPCERFLLYLDLDRTAPEAWAANPLRRQLLHGVERTAPGGCPRDPPAQGEVSASEGRR
jgi:hypothetical protein